MPSNYAKKKVKPKQDSQAYRPYVPPEEVMCSNCGRYDSASVHERYSKCYCGGTFQKFGAKPWQGKSELAVF